MKETTKLGLAFVGAAVVSNMLLASTVAGATSGFPMVAAGGEGLVALGGAYGAWKFKGKKRLAAAIVGGAGAGLLVSSIQGGLLSPAPAVKPSGATAQGTSVVKPAGASLPTPAVGQGPGTPLILPYTTTTIQGITSASGQIPQGSATPTPNRPPTTAELQAYADQMALDAQNQAEAQREMQQALESGSIPITNPDTSYQSGAAVRLGMGRRSGFGGAGAAFRMRKY